MTTTFPYVSAENGEDEEAIVVASAAAATKGAATDCSSVKHRTDALGGLKVQLYGVNSYGYLQFDDLMRKTSRTGDGGSLVVPAPPLLLQDYLTCEEWNEFMTQTIHQIVKRHQIHGWLWKSGLGLGIVSFSALMAIQEFGIAIFVGILFVMILSMSTTKTSPKAQLKEACQQWSMERRRQSHPGSSSSSSKAKAKAKDDAALLGTLEVVFHHEESAQGSILGVLHFLPPQKTMESV